MAWGVPPRLVGQHEPGVAAVCRIEHPAVVTQTGSAGGIGRHVEECYGRAIIARERWGSGGGGEIGPAESLVGGFDATVPIRSPDPAVQTMTIPSPQRKTLFRATAR